MRELAEVEFNIPQESGQVFCHPGVHEFENTARENAELLSGSGLSLGGRPLREVRRHARARLLQEAGAFASRLHVEVPSPPASALLVATGHQPFLFHPGIWIKHLLIDRLAATGVAAAVSIPVDSDAFEEIGADVPVFDGGLRKTHETLVQAPPDVPYETQPRPDLTSWQQFLARIRADLRTLNEPEIESTFHRFVETASGPLVDNIGAFLTVARRRYEGPRRYLEIPASAISRTPEFLHLFLAILRDSPRFAETYNRHLDTYRERYNVRTAAQPFPNLEHESARIELPFWVISGGKRHSMYAERRDRTWMIGTGDGASVIVADTDGPDKLERVEIRPKALTLTAFTRLCVADLFVHGIGGGRYDRVTDAVIGDYFGIRPPRYAVVTATLHLPLHAHNTDAERQHLRRRMLDIQHNPERALTSPSPEQHRLIDEKWRLIRSLDSPEMTRRERRQNTQRIREINERLSHDLNEERAAVELQLRSLGPEADAAARHRGYPYCFFPPQAVDALVDRVIADGNAR